jgi:hypothetical protein
VHQNTTEHRAGQAAEKRSSRGIAREAGPFSEEVAPPVESGNQHGLDRVIVVLSV